ncbi:hypothetical protein [Micromonospora vulcania]|uniref:Lipoprotein n=1 Tax=Micromonospora vulcania TaxID=1441873 RepID=A0ABW1H9N5_9ACTN
MRRRTGVKQRTYLRTAASTVAALFVLTGCTGPARVPDRPSPEASSVSPSPAPPTIRLVEEHLAELHLWVSNQSFTDDPVVLTISIDGVQVVAQPFEVQGQHNWILFPVRVPPGPHVVNVLSDLGVGLQEHFTMPETGRRYAVIDYWNHAGEGARRINWHIQSTMIAFA